MLAVFIHIHIHIACYCTHECLYGSDPHILVCITVTWEFVKFVKSLLKAVGTIPRDCGDIVISFLK